MAIKIPQFTFFCGPNTKQKHDLATQFAEKVKPQAMTSQMYCPLEEAAAALFFNDPLVSDEAFDKPPPGLKGTMTIRNFMIEMAEALSIHYGRDALGQLALEQYRVGGWEEIFAHTIYTDVDHYHDVSPFLHTYGSDNCLCINSGPLTIAPQWVGLGVKIVWLATPTVESQLDQLLRELTPSPTPIIREPSNEHTITRDSTID